MESTARAEDSPLEGSAPRTAHDGTEIVVADAPDRGRIEARHDGTLAGHVSRRLWLGRVVLVHTVTEPDWQGRGDEQYRPLIKASATHDASSA